MAIHVGTQIEQRTRLAEMHRRDQNVVMRAVSGAGLAVANTWDRITQPFRSDRAIFAGATAFGVARGAVLGAVVGVLAIAFAPATAGVGAFLAATAIGGTIAGVYDGQSELERHQMGPKSSFADRIARVTNAIPAPGMPQPKLSKEAQWDLNHPNKPSRVVAHANQVIAEADKTLEQAGFVERENARRAGRGPVILN